MKKILLIEDRKERQQLFMNATDIDFDRYSDVLDNAIDEKYDEIFYKLKDGSFDFENYSVIISHKSAFDKDNSMIVEKLKSYCKTHKKPLVFFSGGIDENYYDKSEYELILMNSKTFYSQNIALFLEAFKNGTEDILMLLYGKKWKLNIALNLLEQLSFFLQKNQKDESVHNNALVKDVDISLLDTISFGYNL
ncbi:MAG: hypothetical protein JJV88_03985, partial [Sulfurovum sp.]|nr:hypothetical protein [Sulfurovaceae bacterium]